MNDQAQTQTPLDDGTALDSLQELAVLYKSIEDVLTDDIITRVGATVGEGLVLLDRLTRNEGLMRLMHALGRPENQFLLMGLADALTETSRQLADSEPAKGGIGGALRTVREPGTEEGLRILAVLGKNLSKSVREREQRRRGA